MEQQAKRAKRSHSMVTISPEPSRASQEEEIKEVGAGNQITPFPKTPPRIYNDHFTIRTTYCDGYILSPQITSAGAITMDQQIWRMNSLYDPDYTNVGHQPKGRDMWASVYNYYAVIACDYNIKLYNGNTQSYTWTGMGSSTRLGACAVTLLRSTVVGDLTPVNNFASWENKNRYTQVVMPEETITFSGRLTNDDFFMSATDQDNDRTWTAVGSNPAVSRYFGINVAPVLNEAITGLDKSVQSNLTVFAELTFTVQFTDVNDTIRNYSD